MSEFRQARNLPPPSYMDWRTVLNSPGPRRALIIASQLVLTALALAAAFALRFEFRVPEAEWQRAIEALPYLLVARLALLRLFRLDRGYWAHVGIQDLLHLAAATTLGSACLVGLLFLAGSLQGFPRSVLVLEGLLSLALMGGVRLAVRCVRERSRWGRVTPGRRTFIVGAGEAGEQILRQLLHDPRSRFQVVGLIDDDPAKRGRALHGVPVLGTAGELRGLVALHRVSQVLVAIPSATHQQLRQLVERCGDAGVEVQLLPPLQDLVRSEVEVSQCRAVRIEDLLGREPVTLDLGAVEPELAGRVIAVTGAGGSIGSELARQVARFHPLRLILIDRAESPLHAIHMEVTQANPEVDVLPVLASVTNQERLRQVFGAYPPDCVFHAAAYKHVPMLECNVVEGIWNNVIGTLRTARCAAEAGARKFVLISTDKAVNPTSVLGATKRVAERVVLELPSLRAAATDFRVVRFGNVLGSDGSVVPVFQRQLAAGGPLTVTHPEVRRYFMTIPESVQLVLQAAALPEAAGRIALLEMGTQVRILDLAEELVRLAGLVPYKDVEIVFTGLRPGEKLEEELVGPGEITQETVVDKIRLVERNGIHGDELARRLRSLTRVIVQQDEPALLRALSALAPEYQPPPQLFRLELNGRHPSRPVNGHREARSRSVLGVSVGPHRRNGNHGGA